MPVVEAPQYSHLTYDVLPGDACVVRRPDVLIVEGLNVLQPPSVRARRVGHGRDLATTSTSRSTSTPRSRTSGSGTSSASSACGETAFADPKSYFHRYAALSDDEASETATGIWQRINEPNLVDNVLPDPERATLVLTKGEDHAVTRIRLRKI